MTTNKNYYIIYEINTDTGEWDELTTISAYGEEDACEKYAEKIDADCEEMQDGDEHIVGVREVNQEEIVEYSIVCSVSKHYFVEKLEKE